MRALWENIPAELIFLNGSPLPPTTGTYGHFGTAADVGVREARHHPDLKAVF